MVDKISLELARITAHICGDGYVMRYKQRRGESELKVHPRKNIFRNKYYIRYVNTERILIEQFIDDVKKEFNRSVIKLRRHEFEVSGKNIYDIITRLGAGKSRDWFISNEIVNSNKKVKIEWLKAFFDDEAHVSTKKKEIVVSVINKKGIKQIKKLIGSISIYSYLRGPYEYTFREKKGVNYYLIIPKISIRKYSEIVGFYHPKKIRALKEIITLINKNGAAGNSNR